MRLYLAARFSRAAELEGYAQRLRDAGHEVVSRWHGGTHPLPGDEEAFTALLKRSFAEEDVADLMSADAVVSFTEDPRSTSRGGRHVEFGMAVAASKTVVVVGPRENVFHFLFEVRQFDTFDAFLGALGEAK